MFGNFPVLFSCRLNTKSSLSLGNPSVIPFYFFPNPNLGPPDLNFRIEVDKKRHRRIDLRTKKTGI